MTAGWDLNLGDCLHPEKGLASVPEGSIDVTITDPPYGPQVDANYRRHAPGGGYVGLGVGDIDDQAAGAVAAEIGRVTRRWALVFCDVERAHTWRAGLTAAGMRYVRTGAWIKPDGCPQFTGDRPAVGFEAIVIAHAPGALRWNGGGHQAVWTCGVEKANRIHPTQKPLVLMETLVRLFTDRDDVVLDPFSGSATTGVAALRWL